MIPHHFKQKTTTSQKIIEVAIKRIGDGTPAFICLGQHYYYIEDEENVDDQENIRRIMENSCI